jgi:hypothetical protein
MFYKKQFFIRMANYNKFGFMVVVFPLDNIEVTLGSTIFYKQDAILKSLNLLFVEEGRKKVLFLGKGRSYSLFFEADANRSVALEIYDHLYIKMNDAEIKEVFENKISTLHELSTRRPLLAREKFELAILEKLQAADNLEQLENLKNEVENEATDAQLKTQLLIIIEEKKGFC